MRGLANVVVLLLSAQAAHAQSWTSKLLGTVSPEEATKRSAATFPGPTTMDIKSGYKLYKVSYSSHDGHQARRTSGLVALPTYGASRGLVLYYQGTILERSLSPSRYTGKNKSPEVEAAILAFCLRGFAVALPDTFGIGDDKRAHPYPLGGVNCQTGIDLVPIARKLLLTNGCDTGPDNFVAGYSEGGVNAMATVKKVESAKSAPFGIKAAAPMSGPYDLSGTMTDWLVGSTADAGLLAFKFVALAYSGRGLSDLKGTSLKDIFVPSFASYVLYVLGGDMKTEDIAKKLLLKGTQLGAIGSVNKVLQPGFRKQLAAHDVSNPLIKAFHESDCYKWLPKTPMILPYLPTDNTVPPENTLRAAAAMESTGYVRPVALQYQGLNHVSATIPALMTAAAFFVSDFEGVDAIAPSVYGNAGYLQRIAIVGNAKLVVSLEDVSLADAPAVVVASESRLFDGRQAPLPYRVTYDRAKIEKGHRYVVRAVIEVDGKTKFRTTRSFPFDPARPGAVDLTLDMTN